MKSNRRPKEKGEQKNKMVQWIDRKHAPNGLFFLLVSLLRKELQVMLLKGSTQKHNFETVA